MDPETTTDTEVFDNKENDTLVEDDIQTEIPQVDDNDHLDKNVEDIDEQEQTMEEVLGRPLETNNEVVKVDEYQKDEGIEEGDLDTKDDTYSSPSDSLIDNVDSLTLLEDETTSTQPAAKGTPRGSTSSTQSPEPQKPSPNTDSVRQTSAGKKEKRKNKDFKPTVVKPFSFTMDKRIEDRQKYNEKVQKMQKAQEERERLEKERQEKEQEEELKFQRKKTIPKAKPIRYYKPITITPSKRPLTMPEAPVLCLENRLRTTKVGDKQNERGSKNTPLKQVS